MESTPLLLLQRERKNPKHYFLSEFYTDIRLAQSRIQENFAGEKIRIVASFIHVPY